MTENRTLVRVFLGSPGDLPEERELAPGVVKAINKELGELLGCVVQLDKWEDTPPASEHPQDYLNKLLNRCDVFVGMLHEKWGMPTKGHSSGFLEEYEVSRLRRSREAKPEILLFFKQINLPEWQKRNPHPDIQRVLEFKRKVEADAFKYVDFANAQDFADRFRSALIECIIRMQRGLVDVRDEARLLAPPSTSADISPPKSKVENVLSDEGAAFARAFLARTGGAHPALPASDVARFRLLGTLVGSSENDVRALGPHDANLLFAQRESTNFGRAEILGLFDAGLEAYGAENVPIWYWYSRLGPEVLVASTVMRPKDHYLGAIRAIRTIGLDLEEWSAIDRKSVLESWLADDSHPTVRVAALQYLGDHGTMGDLRLVEKEYARNDSQTTVAAVDAGIRINLRTSKSVAFAALWKFSPTSPSSPLVDELFVGAEAVETELLRPGLAHRGAAIRRKAASELATRRSLSAKELRELLNDDDQWVRYEALKYLIPPDDKSATVDVRPLLVKKSSGLGLGLFGSQTTGEEAYSKYVRERLAKQTTDELEAALALAEDTDGDAFFALAERQFDKYRSSLRKALEAQLSVAAGAGGGATYEHLALGALATDWTERKSRSAVARRRLDILERKGDRTDLRIVRRVLDAGITTYSPFDLDFISRNGDLEDAPRILKILDQPSEGTSLLASIPDDGRKRVGARALYAIGKKNYQHLLEQIGSHSVLPWLLDATPDTVFSVVPLTALMPLLYSAHDDTRKCVAIKIVKSITKTHVKKILETYVSSSGTYYYNVVHWLDLGTSLPRRISGAAAARSLKQMLA